MSIGSLSCSGLTFCRSVIAQCYQDINLLLFGDIQYRFYCPFVKPAHSASPEAQVLSLKDKVLTGYTYIYEVVLCAAEHTTDPSQNIEIGISEQFIITLESNPTTGYEWQADFDESLLKLVQDELKPAKTEPSMTGVGCKQSFTFQGVKKGKTEVTLTYKRSWEEGFAEQKVFAISIK